MYNIETGAFYSVGEEGMNGYVVIKYVCPLSTNLLFVSESIDCFIEDKTFSPSYDLTPPPTLFPSLPLSVCHRSSLPDGRWGGGGGGGANQNDGVKAWSSINNTIISGWYCHTY
jgi:hypothetical protein